MADVELVEGADDGAPGAPGGGADAEVGRDGGAGARFVRRHRGRLLALALVLLTLLALGAVRDARADRARAAALAITPGVLDTVSPAPDGGSLERWRRPALDEVVAGGDVVVTAGVDAQGRGAVTAYDATSGRERWGTTVPGVGPQGELTCVLTSDAARVTASAPASAPVSGRASVDGARGPVLACVAVPAVGKEAWGGLGRRGQVRLVVLDAATGAPVRDVPADRSDLHVAALGADLVLTRTVPGGLVRVTRHDARTGEERWRFEGEAREPVARGPQPAVTRVQHGLLLVDGGRLLVLDGDGRPVDAWPSGVERPDVLVVPSADDGSQAGLGLVARPVSGGGAPGGVTLDAVATGARGDTGRPRWSAQVDATSVLVVDGRVVTTDETGTLTARDARGGDVLWSSGPRSWLGGGAAPLGAPLTDGVHVLVPLAASRGAQDEPVLVAVDRTDGRAVWTAPLPADVRGVERAGRRLLGRTATEVVALGQD